MTTETTAQETTEATGDTSNTSTTEATEKSTLLTGDKATEGTTADGAKTGDQGAETDTGDKSKDGEDGKSKTDDGKTADGPPEKYEFEMPEGVELDAKLAEAVDPVLRDLGLTNEQANKLAKTFAEYRVSEAQGQSDAYAQQIEDWGKAARDDKEYGGAKFEENVPLAHKAIAQYGTPELKALLAEGLGNHPEVVRFCIRVGKAMGEDPGVDTTNATPAKSTASVLFDHPSSTPKR